MIIRRIAKGIKDQDWFVVMVEVLIVVVGIFIGLQVTEWNEERKERGFEQEYLVRILADFDQSLEDHVDDLEKMELKVQQSTIVVEMIYDKNLNDSNRKDFEKAYRHITSWGGLTVVDNTLDELNATGRMSLIHSADLRNDINEFLRKYEEYEKVQINIQQLMMQARENLGQHTSRSPNSRGREILTTNEEFLINPSIYRALDHNLAIYDIILQTATRINAETKVVRSKVAEYLEGLQ